MKINFMIVSLLSIFLSSLSPAQTEITYRGEPAFGSLKFVQPLAIVPVPFKNDELLVVEKCGQIQRVQMAHTGAQKSQIFDISRPSDGVFEQGGECGLLGAALHPGRRSHHHGGAGGWRPDPRLMARIKNDR